MDGNGRLRLENIRKVERRHLIYYLKVIDQETDQIIGHAVNISNEGILLISEKPIKTEVLFQLKMFLPEKFEGSRYFEFSAVSKWSREDENPDFYNTGFHLNKVSTEAVQVIKRLIDKFCFDE